MVVDADSRGLGMTSQRARDRLAARLAEKGVANRQVLDAMRQVPRHLFIDEALANRAYEDNALPIGRGQTISQPYIVAIMTQAILRDGAPAKALEVGTGCGYQAAVLCRVVPAVFTIERIRDLLAQAKRRFRRLKISNIMAKHGDGAAGWPESAPFDAIVVTAAAERVPENLLRQLSVGGRMVIPLGKRRHTQELRCIARTERGYESESLGDVSFVPFCGGLA